MAAKVVGIGARLRKPPSAACRSCASFRLAENIPQLRLPNMRTVYCHETSPANFAPFGNWKANRHWKSSPPNPPPMTCQRIAIQIPVPLFPNGNATGETRPRREPGKKPTELIHSQSLSQQKKPQPFVSCKTDRPAQKSHSRNAPSSPARNSSTTPETDAEESGASALLRTPEEYSLPIAPIILRISKIRDLIQKIPLTLKTHESQEAARPATQGYLDELTFLQRLANTMKRDQRERESSPPQKRTIVQFPESGNG